MPYNVNNNAFTAQGSTVVLNGSPSGSYGNRAFGTKCVMAPNIDRLVCAGGDGENGNYASSWWHYDIDNVAFTRTRPDPSNLVGKGAFADSPNHYQDTFGIDRGDNKQLAYHPATGKIMTWGGNAGLNSGGDAQDPTWFNHYNSNLGPGPWGVYLYDPMTDLLTMPSTAGWTEGAGVRHLSAAQCWEPTAGVFLQVMGESAGGGFSLADTKIYAILPDGSAIFLYDTWAADGIAGPLGRTNIGHQWAYHSRAKKWIVFGGNSALGSGGYTTHSDTWMWDPAKPSGQRWTRLADGPEGRAFGFLTYDTQNNVMILTGGCTNGSPGNSPPHVTTTWAFSLEYNKWTDQGVSFSRACGGAVYDPTRNLHLYTGGDPTDTTNLNDVYAFRYAIPRATMVTNEWVAVPIGSPSVYFWPEKHHTQTFCPLNRRLYGHGGDTHFHYIDQNGSDQGSNSYYQRDYSWDVAQRFATPGNRDIGARQETPMCVGAGQVRPKHPDFVGWVWDSKRSRFWHVPGLGTTSSTFNCPTETPNFADDPSYLQFHMMTYDPLNPSAYYTDVTGNHGTQYTGDDWPWRACYDAIQDRIIRLEMTDDFGDLVCERFDPNTGTWSYTHRTQSGQIQDVKMQYWDYDPQRRCLYIADRFAGRLSRYDLDTNTLVNLGFLPGTPTLIQGQGNIVKDKGAVVFDWNARVLIYNELMDNGHGSTFGFATYRVWRYTPDTPTAGPNGNGWTQIAGFDGVTLPFSVLDGDTTVLTSTAVPHPAFYGGCFDPDNNCCVFWGLLQDIKVYWILRNTDMGVGGAPSTLPHLTPPLVPASCAPGSAGFELTINGTLFSAGAVVKWNGAARATTFVSATQVTATILASDVVAPGSFPVSVTTLAPGGPSDNSINFVVAYPPATLALVWNGKIRDRVGPSTLGADGQQDGTLTATITTPVTRTVTHVRLSAYDGALVNIGIWDTSPAPFYPLGIAAALDAALGNDPTTFAVSFAAPTGTVFCAFASDVGVPNEFLVGNTLTMLVTFSDGTTATASVVIGSSGPPAPVLLSVTPNIGPAGTLVTLTGTNFGATQSGSFVTIGGSSATIQSWGDSGIACFVPASLLPGDYSVTVTTSGGVSNALQFTIPQAAVGAGQGIPARRTRFRRWS